MNSLKLSGSKHNYFLKERNWSNIDKNLNLLLEICQLFCTNFKIKYLTLGTEVKWSKFTKLDNGLCQRESFQWWRNFTNSSSSFPSSWRHSLAAVQIQILFKVLNIELCAEYWTPCQELCVFAGTAPYKHLLAVPNNFEIIVCSRDQTISPV